MLIHFAHNGVDHATESDNFGHFLSTDGLKVLALAAITIFLLIGIAKLLKPTVNTTNPKEQEDE